MIRRLLLTVLCAGTLVASVPQSRPERPNPASVLILANSRDEGSLRIARHYAEVRQVPSVNIIALPMPPREVITWGEFVTEIWSPLVARLVTDGWVDAIPMNLHDAVGRRKYAVHAHRVLALVTCRGVPLRIEHDERLYAPALPFTTRAEYRTNGGAVDAELSLLPSPNYAINAFVPNPLFQNDRPGESELQQVIRVSRLDGPTVASAVALVDNARAAERHGLVGPAFVDLSARDPVGNDWLERTARHLAELGFETHVDREPDLMPATTRMGGAAFYFGWYAADIGGALAAPDFHFAPGAVGIHIHSYSAATLRSPTTGWSGPLVARGVTATVGNVNEPYLNLTHRPNLLLRKLAAGATWSEAGYYAVQGLSWQAILIGDPLYQPFAKRLND